VKLLLEAESKRKSHVFQSTDWEIGTVAFDRETLLSLRIESGERRGPARLSEY